MSTFADGLSNEFIFMDIQYLVRIEEKMENELLRLCTERGALKGMMLETEDITEQWKILAPEYMADAVPEIANYPTVSVSWAAYLGLAVAYGWDADWETFLKMPYQSYYGEQGFDDMDEHIVRDLLRMPLDSRSAKELENTIRARYTFGVVHAVIKVLGAGLGLSDSDYGRLKKLPSGGGKVRHFRLCASS